MKFKSLFCFGALLALSITGCGGNTPAPHVHTYDKENVEWVWTQLSTGDYNAKAIFECTGCEEDAEGHTVEVTATVTSEQTVTPTCSTDGKIVYTATAVFEEQNFTATKEKVISDENAHHFVEVVDAAYLKSAATCTEDAVYFKSCEYCHEKSGETFTAANTKLGHHVVQVAAKGATCTEDGNIAHYKCDRDGCGKLFSDAAGAHEITADSVVIAKAHHYIEVKDASHLKSTATCTEDAVYFKSCEYCHENGTETFTDANTKLGHHIVHVEEQESTCEAQGHFEHYKCDRDGCGKLFSDEAGEHEVTPESVKKPTAHGMVAHDAVAATCTAAGNSAYYTCNYCGRHFSDADGNNEIAENSWVINALGHEFNDSLNCVRGDKTLKEELEMEDATVVDSLAPVTISDLGIASESAIPAMAAGHLFGNYDYSANGGIDLWIKYEYVKPVADTDYYSLFYLFNAVNEDGIVLRLSLSRAADDGVVPAYIYTQEDYSGNPGTTVVHTAGQPGTKFYFPSQCGVTSETTNLLHLNAYCVDASTNLFRCTFTIGVEGGTQYYPATSESDDTNTPISFDIELGTGYFDGNAHQKFRVSCTTAERATVYNAASEESVLVYKNAAGQPVGKLNTETANLPNLVAENKTFLGWFDPHGNRIANGASITTKTVVTPRFVDTQENMFVPSDTLGGEFAAAKGGWFESTSIDPNPECGGRLPVSEVTDRYDVYFIYHYVSNTNNDNYAIFGIPFDFIEGNTRLNFRIDNSSAARIDLSGYIYNIGTNLGGAGAEGTHFSQAGFRANGSDLLIHATVYNTSDAGLTFTLEIVNLGDGQTFSTTRDVTFNTTGLYAINEPNRNVFDLMKKNCEYRITDAF